jgi:pimeloyl-ACP methyl ester carboxylesterase
MITRLAQLISTAAIALVVGNLPPLGDVSAEAVSPSEKPKSVETAGVAIMNAEASSHALKTQGATIYYEVRGTGPVLLVIPGGPQDAGVFAELGRHLSDRYTVVTFDPRGNSRSTFDGAPEELDVSVQAYDAALVVGAVGDGPAYVFGTSGGAQIGLELAARHPDVVRALIAHEPPAMMLLDDPGPEVAFANLLHDTYRTDGVDAAMGMFFEVAGFGDADDGDQTQPKVAPTAEAAATFQRVRGNFEYWLAHGIVPLSTYVPDIATLRGGQPAVVVAIGEDSAGFPIDAMSRALAAKLGVEPVAFPGDHIGFEAQPAAFAEAVDRAFKGR